MKCFYHNSDDSVALCPDCNKGLCYSCASAFTVPICKYCFNKRSGNEQENIAKELMWMVIVTLGLTFLSFSTPNFKNAPAYFFILIPLIIFYLTASIIVDWKTVNKITPRFFLFLPVIGWIIYLFVKFYASMMVGMFVSPFWLFKRAKRFYTLKRIA